ncbi:hypothetical protein [Hahella ganghwensis]|uniref:hypothetical protein n=1 Tax=Hahella ganghwensis TaxID=286420 RepID=UPI00036C6708|nr:hypothetical protein [Hahella ganghwensis]
MYRSLPATLLFTLLVYLLVTILASLSTTALAHSDVPFGSSSDSSSSLDNLLSYTRISAGLSATYREDTIAENSVWQIPGVLMGGDAHAPEKSFSLDDASLMFDWKHPDGVFAGLEFSKHGDHDLEMEEAYAGLDFELTDTLNLEFTGGSLKAAFSPENTTHAYQRPFSENDLLYDAFYGGHYADEGVRFELSSGSLTLGTEIWRGDQFPATAGTGGEAQDIYLYWLGQADTHWWRIGGWIFNSRGDARTDDRLSRDHQHGTTDSEDAANIYFDGAQQAAGFHLTFGQMLENGWQWRISGEVHHVRVDGNLTDDTRAASLEGRYYGYWIQPELEAGKHLLAVRYALLNLDNHLIGAAGESLASDSGLTDMDEDPTWLGMSYRYRLRESLAIRLEWTHNQSVAADNNYGAVGITWGAAL